MAPGKRARRWLYLGHRWAGIGACLLFVLWFVSGLVMLYVRAPALTEAERLAGLAPIDWARVQQPPDAVLAAAGAHHFPRELRLVMLNGEPAYLLRDERGQRARSAVDGRALGPVDAAGAEAGARRFAGTGHARWQATFSHDLWTAPPRFDTHRPFHRVALEDAAGTELYIAVATGEVVLDTRRRERFWNRLGVVLHYVYLTELRANVPLWRQTILALSALGMAVAFSGTAIGLLRLRLRRRYRGGRVTPYRGWLRWHHLGGLIGGIVICTWITSGWLSMRPNQWLARPALDAAALDRHAGQTRPRFGPLPPVLRLAGAREAQFGWLDGEPQLRLLGADGQRTVLNGPHLTQGSPTPERITRATRQLLPDHRLLRIERLEQPDAHWYTSPHRPRPLPVLRAIFDDPAGTWVHIDPATGQPLDRLDRSARAYRWLFNALHSFDLPWLLRHRPLRDALVWLLSLAGLLVSVSGVVIGWRRLSPRPTGRA